MTTFRDNGGKLPPRPQWKEWVKEHQEILRKINRNPRYLKPIVKVRRDDWKLLGITVLKAWHWKCDICHQTAWTTNWNIAQNAATHHAHNHHRR